jgi:site-specific recombinase XerD
MRFLMKTIVVRPAPRLIHAFRQNLSGCAWALAAVFVSSAKPGSGHPRVTGAAQLQLSVFWHQFNPASQSCCYGNIPNVAAELRLARTPRGTRPKGLVAPEVQALLRAAGQSRRALARRNYAVVQLLLQAGLRVSEAAALRLGDLEIHERQGRVHICGKGNKERYVPLNATARRALHAYLDARKEAGTQDPVFLSETGTALSVRSIQSLITELARRAHLGRIPVSAHTLRHTFALGYLKQNPGKLVELATLLGHESLDTTAIYSLPSEEDLAAEVERSSYNIDA